MHLQTEWISNELKPRWEKQANVFQAADKNNKYGVEEGHF